MIRLLPFALVAAQSVALAGEKSFTYTVDGASEAAAVSFIVGKEDYQHLLKQLPEAEIELNTGYITKLIARRLTSLGIPETEDQSIEALSQKLYEEVAVPVLKPRVEKFNELLNAGATKDKVSAGFIAFTGLAKSMASRSRTSISTVSVSGQYDYTAPDFDKGTWTWWDNFSDASRPTGLARESPVSGTTKIHVNLSGSIDEDIEFDLTPYGSEEQFTLNFECSGEVGINQILSSRYVWNEEKPIKPGPVTRVGLRPVATIKATKEFYLSSGFGLVGSDKLFFSEKAEKVILYPAVLKFDITAREG